MIQSKFRTLLRVIQSLWAYLRGKPINKANLSFGTVDWNDVKIAWKRLNQPDSWNDTEVIKTYEKAFSTFNDTLFSFSFLQGRVALSACLHALGLSRGDKIIVPAYTCVAVPNACWIHDLEPVFCDIELDTYGLSLDSLKAQISKYPEVKAIIVQHLFGLVCRDFQHILDFARKKGIQVIEDCAHATGASFNGIKVGNFGAVAFFSSEQSKVFSTLTGGMAVTNDEALAQRMADFQNEMAFPSYKKTKALLYRFIEGYFKMKHPYRSVVGPIVGKMIRKYKRAGLPEEEHICRNAPDNYYFKLPAPLAKIGIHQIEKLPLYQKKRLASAEYWRGWCKENGLNPPLIIPNSVPAFLRYPVLADPSQKKETTWAAGMQISLGVWFVSHLHPVEYAIEGCPNAEKAIRECINFPTLGA